MLKLIICLAIAVSIIASCEYKTCTSCLNTTETLSSDCRWCGRCVSKLSADLLCKANSDILRFDDTCPVSHPRSSPDLSDWMGRSMDVIGHLTLLDISLPGTHDTLTNDLDVIVSDAGAGDMLTFAKVMHDYHSLVPDCIEDFIRQQAQTQDLTVTEQLDNGIRFIDFRMMFEYSDADPDWYSLHFVQSRETAMKYFSDIRAWLDLHPDELVVLWLTKHGSENAVGQDQYPNTTVAQKQEFWGRIEQVFSGLLVDFRTTQLNETSLRDMLRRGHRVVVYASDYVESTGSSPFALDSSLIDNEGGPNVDDEVAALAHERQAFAAAPSRVQAGKAKNRFYLMSLATGVPAETTFFAATIRFLPHNKTDVESLTAQCAAYFHLEGLHWCPETLLDIAQLENYYKQISLEEALTTPGWGFPNAIYINGVDWDGTIRTGTQVLWGAPRSSDVSHETTAYAYADSMILYNIRLGCATAATGAGAGAGAGAGGFSDSCATLQSRYEARRKAHPKTLWTDSRYGRLENWPL